MPLRHRYTVRPRSVSRVDRSRRWTGAAYKNLDCICRLFRAMLSPRATYDVVVVQADGKASVSSESDPMPGDRGIEKGYKMFNEGHVYKVNICTTNARAPDRCFVSCNVAASMKKLSYTVRMRLTKAGSIQFALCLCTAGLTGSCNHVAALAYPLEDLTR